MKGQRAQTSAGDLVRRIAACDVLILGLAAGVAWFLGWRTLAGFARVLLWTGAAAAVCGGGAAVIQGLLARASRVVEVPAAGNPGFRNVLAQALSGEDAALQMLLLTAGSGVLWAVSGALLVLVVG